MTSELSVTGADADLRDKVTDFLYAEAELLDEREFVRWFELFDDDCTYWVPAGADEPDPSRTVSLVYDTHATLSERVWRFEGGLAYAQQPASVTSHLISNVVVDAVTAEAGSTLVSVHSRFLVSEFRGDVVTPYAGRYDHVLVVGADGGFRIRSKRVALIGRNGHLGNLGLPL